MPKLLLALLMALFSICPALAGEVLPAAKPLQIVASFSLLGDIVSQIGGEDVAVTCLVGPDEDAHSYQPTTDDARKLAQADIIAINGLKFEGWIGRAIKASGTKAKLLVASAGVKPRFFPSEQGETVPDPHAWLDLRNGEIYARNIAAALIAARPDKAPVFKEKLKDYVGKIQALQATADKASTLLSAQERRIITNHDAFGYFGAAYGLTFLAPSGISDESEPSAAAVARLITQIKKEKISRLFIENMSDPRLMEQIARETGVSLGGKLYPDALSKPGGEATTYLDLMRTNLGRLLKMD